MNEHFSTLNPFGVGVVAVTVSLGIEWKERHTPWIWLVSLLFEWWPHTLSIHWRTHRWLAHSSLFVLWRLESFPRAAAVTIRLIWLNLDASFCVSVSLYVLPECAISSSISMFYIFLSVLESVLVEVDLVGSFFSPHNQDPLLPLPNLLFSIFSEILQSNGNRSDGKKQYRKNPRRLRFHSMQTTVLASCVNPIQSTLHRFSVLFSVLKCRERGRERDFDPSERCNSRFHLEKFIKPGNTFLV